MVLLHNGNLLPSIPVGHSVQLKESYDTLKVLLEKVKYVELKESVYRDLKVISILPGQQAGYTKFNIPASFVNGTVGLHQSIGQEKIGHEGTR